VTTPIFYNEAYVCSAHSFDTTRKARWVFEGQNEDPNEAIEFHSPPSLTAEQVSTVHDPTYVSAIKTGEPRSLAESQGFAWDAGLWNMVLATNGGVVAAAKAAMQSGQESGSLSSGLHHARRETGRGFCTFNGLVLAANAALVAGAERVLILDLDAHCGGGTQSLIKDDPRIWQVDVSVNSFDQYDSSERATLSLVDSAGDYLPTIDRELKRLLRTAPKFDLCLYNAGVDPHERCAIGGLSGIDTGMLAKREMIVFEWGLRQRVPIAFVLAGGYVGPDLSQDELVLLHRLTIEAAS
jgi:acetoin utilization deacetylase AcuC-like enzyme